MSAYTNASAWCEAEAERFRVTEPLVWEVGRKGSGLHFVVPAGFLFEVSVPRVLRWAARPADPRYLKAAAVHDLMLVEGWDRVTAGAEFHAALRADGVGRWRRLAMWLAVSLWKWT